MTKDHINSGVIGGCLGGIAGMMIGAWLGSMDIRNIRLQAIERGFMTHDYKSNQFHWKDKTLILQPSCTGSKPIGPIGSEE